MKNLQTDLNALYQGHKASFERYRDLLIRWNSKINLTAITLPAEIDELHFIDSLAITAWLRETGIVSRETFDIGAGAGLPGLPLKIIDPSINLTLIDAVKKKCDFMKEVARSLSLTQVNVIHDRVDQKKSFGQFDLVVSRAAFKLKDLMSYARPSLKPSGFLVAMKSLEIEAELKEAESSADELGYSKADFFQYMLPQSNQNRQLVVLKG